ncbi:hypothetical protein N798_02980 [Knoellia flava TL1]|uniref:Uncharacterized protein n=2 Tax=Knoellia flava TaxID=913969 RepID=A0A8H9FQE2_9MICO|nr:hypothetical protein N798_02980 [Knoellia flava TL1]GGB69260.1 hypothetical protein GCM10011314_05700 [Knoellia flava]
MPCRPEAYGVAMSDREPFFEPRRPPGDEPSAPRRFVNHPWMPPLNVVPALLAADLEVVATEAVVARVAEVRVYDRGMLIGSRHGSTRTRRLPSSSRSACPTSRGSACS